MHMAKNLLHLIGIARTLARNDALFPVEMLNIPSLTLFVRLVRRRRKDLTPGQRLAKAFQELGPSFIKLGQALSTRSDLVGEQIAADLTMLRDQLPPFSTAEVKEIIQAELGAPVSQLFMEFDEVPVAAASIMPLITWTSRHPISPGTRLGVLARIEATCPSICKAC